MELQLLTLLGPFYLGSIGTGIGSSLGAGGAAGLGYMRPSLNIFLHQKGANKDGIDQGSRRR